MNTLIIEFDRKNNQLNFAESKLRYLSIFKIEEIEIEIRDLTDEIIDLSERLQKFSIIEVQKDLMIRQLDEYIEKIRIQYSYPFSKSQGLSQNTFYFMPLMDIKNILFSDLRGISGAILNLTLDEKDSVNNKREFLELLENTKTEIVNSQNLYDLYNSYKDLSLSIREDFC